MNSVKTKSIPLDQIDQLAIILAKYLAEGDVVALTGDLGAGKTTLVSHVAKYLQLQIGHAVSSPTYVLHHIYEADIRIHHIDLYRLKNMESAEALGFEEFLGKEGISFIEWFTNFPGIWTGPTLHIQIEIVDLEHRSYIFSTNGAVPKHWAQMFDEIQKKWNI